MNELDENSNNIKRPVEPQTTTNYTQYSRTNYSSSNNEFKPAKPKKEKHGSKIIVPFISGMLGASLIIGICFGVPGIKSKILTIDTSTTSVDTSSEGLIKQNSSVATNLVNLTDYSNTSIAVAEKVLPSVVGITVTYNVSSIFGNSEAQASGSGIIISEDGYILTNNHVVSSSTSSSNSYYQLSEATKLTVNLYNDKTEYNATIIGTDSYSDLAVLKIEASDLTAATLGNSENVKVGEFVMAIGNPLGMDSSVTCGVVSAVDREVSDTDGNTYLAIQTDAAINSGNSGGALVNANGEVIGINTLKLSGSDVEGIGFAIPISTTTEIVNQLIEFQTVKRPYIGIIGTTVDDSTIERYNFPQGVYVRTVEENSPAANAGLKVGDIITKINGDEISSIEQLNRYKNTHSIGETITLTIVRNGEEIDVEVTLGETPEATITEETDEPEINQNSNSNKPNNRNNYDNYDNYEYYSDDYSIFDFFR